MKRSLLSMLLSAALALSASGAEAPDFERDVLPLLKNRCVKCHGPAKHEGGLNLSHAAGLARGGESGPVVTAKDSGASLIWKRVAADEMPEDEPLSAAEKQVIKDWIEAGAIGLPSGGGEKADHWAFQKLSPTTLPKVRHIQWSLGPIDRYIQVRLERQNLEIGAPTNRPRLLRRLSFDLLGLPPRLEELDPYSRDAAPDATERMIDRVLASLHYGERYGRHWLDAAGYADSNGYFFADTDRPLAYKYRDYVIRAINADKPFDRFVCDQLAGDELTGFRPGGPVTPEMIEGLVATHYLRNGPDGTGESDGNPDEVLADKYFVLEASLQIVGTSLLGMTVQCARCHDHKFEPLTQRDYYQLQAIIYPALNLERWQKPAERLVDIATTAERAAWRRMQPEAADVGRLSGRFKDLGYRRGTPQSRIACVRDQSADPPEVWLLERGGYRARKEKVAAAAPAVLCRDDRVMHVEPVANGLHGSTGRRLAFARWLTQPESRPASLLARVTVNRLWQNHFGTGIVPTSDNLGYSGAAPTHPALLEYLAGELVRSNWSVKHVQRLIVSSAAYRETSRPNMAGAKTDPDNALLWRFPLRRLDADSVRDAMLAATGELDERRGGPYVPTKQTGLGEVVVDESLSNARRRSIYLQQRRMQVPSVLAVFDAPLMVYNCTRRNSTTIPLQSLSLLNSEFARNRAKALAARVGRGSDHDAAVTTLFMLAVARPPTDAENSSARQFLKDQPSHYPGRPDAKDAAWIDLCQMVFSSNAFLYVE